MIKFYQNLIIGFFLFLFSLTYLFAQEIDFSKSAAVVEYDSLEISISGKKASFIKFYFHRRLRIKIQSEEGVKTFNKFIIPDIFDPILIIHAPKDRNAGKYFAEVNVENFDVIITKASGEKYTPEVSVVFKNIRSARLRDGKYGSNDRFIYKIENIQQEDILEIDYSYSVPYSENLFNLLTLRIFFHGKYPIIQKDLIFTIAKVLDAEVSTFNSDNPIVNKGKKTVYHWHYEQLPGCMSESGSRPYKSLPYVIISIMPDEMLYTLPYSFEERFIPFYVFGPSFRENRHLTIVRAITEGVNNNQYNQLRRFIESQTQGLPIDTSGYTQLWTIHNFIADNFEFDGDIEYLESLDVRDEKLGDFITKEVLRDRSRYNIYVGIIAALGLNYYTGYLSDIRSGVISSEYFEPTIFNDFIFAVLIKTGSVQFLYPKKDRFGYYLNELPFYFENTLVRLISLNDFRNYKTPIEERFLSINTPPSTSADNMRKQTAIIHINLDSLSMKVETNISLAGQYSTLGRGVYLYNSCDPTVNPMYCMNFWENISFDIEPDFIKIENIEEDFPFKTTINASFQSNNAFSVSSDTLVLDLSGWFCHVVDSNLKADNRYLAYYPDFKSTDVFTYKINFNKKVKILDTLPNVQINNVYGNLTIKSVQNVDGSIILCSRFSVDAEKIHAEKIEMVEKIQKQIKDLNRYKIRFVVESE